MAEPVAERWVEILNALIEDSTFVAQKSPLSRGEPHLDPVSARFPPLAPIPISLIMGTIGLRPAHQTRPQTRTHVLQSYIRFIRAFCSV